MIDAIDKRLWNWADWIRSPSGVNLGYPNADMVKRSVFGGQKLSPVNDIDAQEIELIVNRAPGNLKRIAELKYIKQVPQFETANKMRVSKARIKTLVNELHCYIQGALDQKDNRV